MVDKIDDKFENKKLSDSNESKNTHRKIEESLHDLWKKSDELLINRIYEVNTDLVETETRISNVDLKNKIQYHVNQYTEVLWENPDVIQDEKRIVLQQDNKLITSNLTQDIQQRLENNSEDPMSVIGRRKSFEQVQSFTNQVAQEQGFFGKLVKFLS